MGTNRMRTEEKSLSFSPKKRDFEELSVLNAPCGIMSMIGLFKREGCSNERAGIQNIFFLHAMRACDSRLDVRSM